MNRDAMFGEIKGVIDNFEEPTNLSDHLLAQKTNNVLGVKVGVTPQDALDCVRGLLKSGQVRGKIEHTPYDFEFVCLESV